VDHAVHSGMWGGPLIDAITSMCKLIGTLHDADGKVVVSGFEDGVRTPSSREMQNLIALNYTEEKLRKESGLLPGVKVAGDPSRSILEKVWLLPALNVIALDGCHTSVAANKIVHTAKARISCRIVSDQDPFHIVQMVKDHLVKHCPYGAHLKFTNEDALKPWVCVPVGPIFEAAENAMKRGFGRDPVYIGCGGSIGFVEPFAKAFGGAPVLMIGVEDPYTNAHGENESLLVSDFLKCMKSVLHLFFDLHKK